MWYKRPIEPASFSRSFSFAGVRIYLPIYFLLPSFFCVVCGVYCKYGRTFSTLALYLSLFLSLYRTTLTIPIYIPLPYRDCKLY
jgi:hypothetical protein